MEAGALSVSFTHAFHKPSIVGFLKPAIANRSDLTDHEWSANHRLATAALKVSLKHTVGAKYMHL